MFGKPSAIEIQTLNLIAILTHQSMHQLKNLNHMKKLALFTMLGLFALTMNACQSSGAGEQQGDKTANHQPASEKSGEKATIQLNKETFKEKVVDYENDETWNFKGDKPCLVDFYADWCAPCRITSPILEDLAKEYKGRINVYKVDVDKHKELAAAFGVRGIPTFLYCPTEGKPSMTSGIGGTREETKKMFRDHIEEYLLNN